MRINYLLFSSAAALMFGGQALAADAVVAADPEPMEYVRVCDAYGTKFFYIPGTETCLKIGGVLRWEKRFEKVDNKTTYYNWKTRIRLEFEARNDSEWGEVYSWMRYQTDQVNAGDGSAPGQEDDVRIFYYFGIGGLEFGRYDSQWQKFLGYGFTDDGGVYTADNLFPDARQYASYTATFGDFKAFVSLDNDTDEYYAPQDHDFDGVVGDRGHQFMPDVSAGASYTYNGWLTGVSMGYDESDESAAFKVAAVGSINMFNIGVFGFYSTSSENIYFNYDGFSGLLSVQAKLSDSWVVTKDLQFWDNGDWRAVGDVQWNITTGFHVLAEGIYADRDDSQTKSGFLRFERSF